jgi:sugar (pentulose or hexulose) kinase
MCKIEQNRDMAHRMLVALGIDIGTSNTKVVAVDLATAGLPLLASASQPTPSDGTELVELVCRLVRGVALGIDGPVAIGIASMAETGLLVDHRGEPLSPLVRWNSLPKSDHPSGIVSDLGADEFGRRTGLPVSPKVPLLVWERLRTTTPEFWRPGARWSGIADLVALALTDDLVTDHTLAARTGAFAGVEGFDADLLGEVGMPVSRLPRIAGVGEPAGLVTNHAAARFGIPRGTPVFVAGHDHAVGAWAAGVRDSGQVADSLGTAEAMVRILGRPVDRIAVTRAGMCVALTVTGDRECLVAGASGAGALVEAWSDELDLVMADGLDSQPTGILVLPYPSGRQTPCPRPDARVRVIGDSSNTGARTRALFEGLALQARWMYEEQREFAGTADAGPIHVLGGAGASNALWLAIKGSVSPVPVVRVLSREPVATGAAMLAATRAGASIAGPLANEPLATSDPSYEAVFRDFVAAARREP